MQTLQYITSNADKAQQMGRFLGYPISPTTLQIPEIQSLDLKEIITEKTKAAFEMIGEPLLIDDVSLVIKGMNGLPGPFIKYFVQQIGNEMICRMVDQYDTREATAMTMLGYHDGTAIHIFEGNVKGEISQHKSESSGFGWDEIFIPEGYTQIRSEMNEEDYDKTSPRLIALDRLKKFLQDH